MEEPKVQKDDRLAAIAEEQGGYFTSQQAQMAGHSYRNQFYHSSTGNWSKVARGIYRLRHYPSPKRDDLIVLTLLSHNRSGEPQAVVSHESALAIHEISDVNPARIHLTVPPNYRKQMPQNVILHKAALTTKDWEQHPGYRVTTPLRTLLDTAELPSSWPYLADAVYDALDKGLVRASQIALAATSTNKEDVRKWLLSTLDAAEKRFDRKVTR